MLSKFNRCFATPGIVKNCVNYQYREAQTKDQAWVG